MGEETETSHELHLISDGDGLAIIGDPTAIEAFLTAEGLDSTNAEIPNLGTVLNASGAAVTAGSQVSSMSGRWVQLTKESSQLVKKHGLRESSKSGLSTGVIKGKKGQVKGFVEFAKRPSAGLTNPALLAGAGGLMTQMAMQQAMKEITDYLVVIDEKVDDILRAQKDAVLAEMIGLELIIDDVMTVREQVGKVSETSWSKIQTAAHSIAATQAYALRQLDALAGKLETTSDIRSLSKSCKEAEPKIREWLAVLARCFQLQDALAILELDRVLDASPEQLDKHRLGLLAARNKRRELITNSTENLIHRLGIAASRANSKVLAHPKSSPAIVTSANQATESILTFQSTLGIDNRHSGVEAKRWKTAASEMRDKGLETAELTKGRSVEAAIRAKERAGDLAGDAKGKVLGVGSGMADAVRRRGKKTPDQADSN